MFGAQEKTSEFHRDALQRSTKIANPARLVSQDIIFNPALLIPPRPTISNFQWVSGTQYITPADMDILSTCLHPLLLIIECLTSPHSRRPRSPPFEKHTRPIPHRRSHPPRHPPRPSVHLDLGSSTRGRKPPRRIRGLLGVHAAAAERADGEAGDHG